MEAGNHVYRQRQQIQMRCRCGVERRHEGRRKECLGSVAPQRRIKRQQEADNSGGRATSDCNKRRCEDAQAGERRSDEKGQRDAQGGVCVCVREGISLCVSERVRRRGTRVRERVVTALYQQPGGALRLREVQGKRRRADDEGVCVVCVCVCVCVCEERE